VNKFIYQSFWQQDSFFDTFLIRSTALLTVFPFSHYDFISSVIFNISVFFKTLDFWKQHFVFWKFLYSLNQVNVNHLRIYIKCQLKRTTQITSTFYLLRTFNRLFGLYPFSQHDFKRLLSGSNLTQIDIYIKAKNLM